MKEFPKVMYVGYNKNDEEWYVCENLNQLIEVGEKIEMGRYVLDYEIMVSGEVKIEKKDK